MKDNGRHGVTIGQVAKRTGLSASAIRYYELAGVVSPSMRTDNGYRLFTDADIRRLTLAKQARHLGLTLPETKTLVAQAFTADCDSFVDDLTRRIAAQRTAVAARIAELRELEATLGAVESHINRCVCPPGMAAADCALCLVMDEEGGDPNGSAPM